jgi:hypothetical protein
MCSSYTNIIEIYIKSDYVVLHMFICVCKYVCNISFEKMKCHSSQNVCIHGDRYIMSHQVLDMFILMFMWTLHSYS